MKVEALIPHLFRTEYSKIVAVLCKVFGLSNIQIAEDIASDTFLKASETWGLKGIPDNPKAWLYTVAKNKIKDQFKRELLFKDTISPEIRLQNSTFEEIDIDLSEPNIRDSQLQMLFAVCNPNIPKEGQIVIALRVLCGFGIDEISKALLSNKSTVNKRLLRTKEIFRKHKIELKMPPKEDLPIRLDSVLSVLYLLFNEGYYSTTSEKSIKKELCIESMRLLYMLLAYEPANQPKTNALMALFCFHASRFEARIKDDGTTILYDDQDKKQWDFELIQKGEQYLNLSSFEIDIKKLPQGKLNNKLNPKASHSASKYHLEALIAFWHTRTDIQQHEKWENILQLYNILIQIEYSPVTALNRTYALAMADGKEVAIKEALKIDLKRNHLYHTLLAELYADSSKSNQIKHLKIALELVDTKHDRTIISQKLKVAEA